MDRGLIGLPWWLRGWKSARDAGRCSFDPWVGKSPWRRKWQHTPVSLPEKFHGQRRLEGYSPWSWKSRTRLSACAPAGANYWYSMRDSTDPGAWGLLQLILWSALTCGGLHGWAGYGGSILGYSAGVRFRGAGCWWGGWWVQQSPRFPLSKWMRKSLLPMIGNLSSHSSILSTQCTHETGIRLWMGLCSFFFILI